MVIPGQLAQERTCLRLRLSKAFTQKGIQEFHDKNESHHTLNNCSYLECTVYETCSRKGFRFSDSK
jgi:hypothetical protein